MVECGKTAIIVIFCCLRPIPLQMKKLLIAFVACTIFTACNNKPEVAPGSSPLLTVYPNPAPFNAQFVVQNNSSQPYSLLVYDSRGEKVLDQTVPPGRQQYSLPLQNAPKGTYHAILKTPAAVYRQKFAKI
jgi:hypothetical protein